MPPPRLRWDPAEASDVDDLVRRKRLSLLEVAARDLAGRDDLEQVTGCLSRVADRVLAGAIRLAGASDGLAVIAMGKHGAQELNYSSDVDVVLVSADGADVDPVARPLGGRRSPRRPTGSTPTSAPRAAPACSCGPSTPTSPTGAGGPVRGSSRRC